MDGWIRTPRLFRLRPQSLFKCLLVFQRWPFFAFALRVAFWAIVFCEDAVTLCVEDNEGLDAVEREVHLAWFLLLLSAAAESSSLNVTRELGLG